MKQRHFLSAIMFMYFAASASLFPLFTVYLSRFFSPQQIGILMAIIPVSMIIFQPLWGKIANRFSIKPVLIFSLTLTAASAFGFLFVETFIQYFIVLSVYSVFVVAVLPLIDTMTLSSDSAHYGKIRLWGSIGYGLAVFFSGAFKSCTLGFWSFVLHILLILLTIIIVILIPVNKYTQSLHDGVPNIPTANKNSPFKNRQYIILVLVSFVMGIVMKAYDSFFPVELAVLKASDLLLGSSWVIEIVPEVIIFYILDKLDSKLPSKLIMIIGIFVWILRLTIISCFPILWVWVATQPLSSLAFCFWYFGTNKTLNSTLSTGQKVEGITVFWAITYGVGGVTGSLFSGYMVNSFGIPMMFSSLAVCCLVALLLTLLSKNKWGLLLKHNQSVS